jgi:soluble lytic murein transglycosylase-like protein
VLISAASLAISFPVPARGEPVSMSTGETADRWSAFISEAAERFAIPAAWIRAVMHVESREDPKAISPKARSD